DAKVAAARTSAQSWTDLGRERGDGGGGAVDASTRADSIAAAAVPISSRLGEAQSMSGDEVETSTGTQVETTRKLAAQRQIDAAIDHIKRLELECAITLAAAAETTLPDTANPHFLELLRQHPSFLR